ncbi:adenosylcobinamide amidohydrolase [Candidatus Marinarcus aquaticus]|uniref:Uncharacterized protein n=1 Tax=Candidatus Marinarcus aquaticus TaxID=2044504 RepID=A0A4Q0XT65_9BACT|nr:adenosylcobinamide amidohydrolase [Candidatus Marinarcus aquaticus]RXJ60035.1 hypothetical protein CRV04_03200 [Candidatus Marinarcus aquaticus]
MSQIKLIQHADYIALHLPYNCKVLSSAVLNGGMSKVVSLLNLKVNKNASVCEDAQDTLRNKACTLELPEPTVGMMTAASMKSLGYTKETHKELEVECWVTSGLSNLRRVGDSADEKAQIYRLSFKIFHN